MNLPFLRAETGDAPGGEELGAGGRDSSGIQSGLAWISARGTEASIQVDDKFLFGLGLVASRVRSLGQCGDVMGEGSLVVNVACVGWMRHSGCIGYHSEFMPFTTMIYCI